MAASPLAHPANFQLQAALGWLELGNPREAQAELQSISADQQLHPDVLEAWWRVYSDQKNWLAALLAAERVVLHAPERESGWVAQSFSLHELKRTREAYERLVGVVSRFPSAYVIPYNLACYQCQLGDLSEALLWLRRAVKASDARTIRAMALDDPDLLAIQEQVRQL